MNTFTTTDHLSLVCLWLSLAESIREKFKEPVGCDLFIVRQNGHVVDWFFVEYTWENGTVSRWNNFFDGIRLTCFRESSVPLMYKDALWNVYLVSGEVALVPSVLAAM